MASDGGGDAVCCYFEATSVRRDAVCSYVDQDTSAMEWVITIQVVVSRYSTDSLSVG